MRTCQTLDDCFGSTEYSQYYIKTYFYRSSDDFDPSEICENPFQVCF